MLNKLQLVEEHTCRASYTAVEIHVHFWSLLPLTFLPWVCQIFAWQAPWAHQLHLLIVWSFQYWRHKLLPQEYQDQNTILEPACIIKIMIKAITRQKKDACKLCWLCSMESLAAHCWKHLMEALGQLCERITQKKTYFTFFTSAKQSL